MPFKVGDKVRVPEWMAIGRYNRGIVTNVNGGYIMVTLNYKRKDGSSIECDMLINEVIPGWRDAKKSAAA